RPVGPFLLARDVDEPGPLEAFPSNADSVAQRAAVALHQIKIARRRVDNDSPRRFRAAEENNLTLKLRRQLFLGRRGHVAGALLIARRRGGCGARKHDGPRRNGGVSCECAHCDHHLAMSVRKLPRASSLSTTACPHQPPSDRSGPWAASRCPVCSLFG